jgi:predicted nucleic acid-binding protein
VNIFFDTSVLVAASERNHVHYARAWPVFHRVVKKEDKGYLGMHSIAEVYAALTRLPVAPRIQPLEAVCIVTDTILPYFEVVPADMADYREALHLMAAGGWNGAKIYDALLLVCAAKSKAERIYTFNLSDFQSLAPDDLRQKICAP